MVELFQQGFQWLIEAMAQKPVLLLFIILGVGYLLGNIRLAGFSLGPVAGVLFAGIFFGHYGLRIAPGAQAVGFALFIFSVGYQAGPRFFGALKEDGLRYLALSLTVATTAVLLAIGAGRLLDFEPGAAAGMLAGGLTSSPTLAAAKDAVREGTVALPSGWDKESVMGNIATAYAITYIFGLTGLITIIKYLPRLLGINLAEEAHRLEEAQEASFDAPNITTRRYRVTNEEYVGHTLAELRKRYCKRVPVLKVIRNGKAVRLQPHHYLQVGDVIELIAPRREFTTGIQHIGPELPLDGDIADTQDTAQIVVTNREVVGKSLGDLNIPHAFGVLVLHITQLGVQLPHSYKLELHKGDIITVVGPAAKIDDFGDYMGQIERDISETDMVTFAFGIAAGVLLGMLSINVGGLALGLGMAGGLLATGLVIGYRRSNRPTFGRLPEPARWFLMEFGLLLFMAGVGLRAGGSILQTLAASGPQLILAGIVTTVVPIGVAYFVGSRLLKLNPAILMGALTGAMTSGASLSVVTREADSAVPAIGYAGTYAFGNVLLMLAGPLVIMLS